MLRRTLLKSITAAMLLCATTVVAEERTFVETFISQVKENNQFVTVGDIWTPDNNFDMTEMRKVVSDAQPLSINYARLAALMQKKPYSISLVLPGTDGKTYTLELAQYQVLSNDYEVHARGAGNTDKKVDYTPGLYYRGVVKGIKGSVAAFSFFNNEVWGIFSIPEVGNIVVAPNTMVGNEYDYNPSYVLYNDQDLLIKPEGEVCGTDKLPEIERNRPSAKTTTILNNKVYNSCKQIRWYHVADYAMYLRKGSSTTNCTNYITALFNNNGIIYMNEGVPIQLKYIQINTATDEYQSLPTNSSSAWLTRFGQVTMNDMHGCDLAMLLTTKGGNMGGVAWLDVLCATYSPTQHAGPYAFTNISNTTTTTVTAFPTYSWDVEATSHEMGHNLGSPHTHRCAWGPTRTTAIDGCTTLEGSCANPGLPSMSVKGTVMSYCHLTSVGINLANGFGQQPGDTVRHCINTAINTCGEIYKPNVALAKANRTITADRECTDVVTGITFYYKNGGTLVNSDDTLVLMVRKNGNNIGNMNNSAFSVSTTTLTGWSGGTAPVVTFPVGTSGVGAAGNNYAARRFWKINHTGSATLSSAVDVYFPLLGADTTDVNGSAPGITAPFSSFRMYNVKKAGINPDPTGGFVGATAADIAVYTRGSSSSATNWVTFNSGSSTMLAQFKTTNLYGGGAFFPFGLTNVDDVIANEGVNIFPNPTTNDWNIVLEPGLGEQVSFQLFSADGRLCLSQTLVSGTVNTVSASSLAAGMYFYRVVNEGNVVTGNLIKN